MLNVREWGVGVVKNKVCKRDAQWFKRPVYAVPRCK